MNERTEGLIGLSAAFFVLISAMIDPNVAALLAVAFLLALSTYKIVYRPR
jgi:hypothetical protein